MRHVQTAVQAARPGRPVRPYLTHDRPLFFAHRGGAGIAPENTVAAFEQAIALGANALEIDIQTTREGEPVVTHDLIVDRTTDGSGPVASYTLADLHALDAGYRFTPDGGRTFPFRGRGVTIPTLREVLERFPTTRVNIDLKDSDPEREKRVWQLIQELGVEDRVLVASGNPPSDPILRFRKLSGGRVATSACKAEIRAFVLAVHGHVTRWLRPAYDALQVPEVYRGVRVVSPALIAAAHRLGIAVHVWTVDERADMERLLDWGVDGLVTDRPDILAEVLAQRG